MKAQLQVSLGQHLAMTPQLQQAIRLLQLSAVELEAEMIAAVEANPLLEWDEDDGSVGGDGAESASDTPSIRENENAETRDADAGDAPGELERWTDSDLESWHQPGTGTDSGESFAERVAAGESLHDHLLWQLHLTHLSARDRAIGAALIDAISDDGYLGEPLASVAASLDGPAAEDDELLGVLHRIQRFDPVGVGAQTLSECLRVQLSVLAPDTPGHGVALRIATELLEQLPRLGAAGVAAAMRVASNEVDDAIALLLSLDPRPGARFGEVAADTFIAPDVVIWHAQGAWQASLAEHSRPRLRINRGYEALIPHTSPSDASYLRGHLQEARWLLKNIEARGDTLLRVTLYLVQRQSEFLACGPGALRPLTLREVAAELSLHESTISRTISRKYARTPRGTLPLRAFFASGVGAGTREEMSSAAVQAIIRRLIEEENPRKPLSDARLCDSLRSAGVPVARRTVAKYRESMSIPCSQERVRMA